MTPPDAIATTARGHAVSPDASRTPAGDLAAASPAIAPELVEIPVDLHACRSRNG